MEVFVYKQIGKTFLDVIEHDSTLRVAILALNDSEQKVITIGDKLNNDLILGTISDGDIRRAMLNGASMESRVIEYANKNYYFVEDEFELAEADKILNEGYKVVPIGRKRAENGKMLAFIQNREANESIELSAMIMAGGKGKRLRPLTNGIPKPMINVKGKPMLHHQIDALKYSGVENIYISVGYLKEHIMDYFGDGRKLNVNIRYVVEDVPLGTAGSLNKLPSDVGPLFCVNADLITNLEYKNMIEYWKNSDADILTACQQYVHKVPFGVLDIQGKYVKGIHEKPTIIKYVNTGMYILGQKALDFCRSIDREVIDIPYLIETSLENGGKVMPFVMHEPWIDVGTPKALALANNNNG